MEPFSFRKLGTIEQGNMSIVDQRLMYTLIYPPWSIMYILPNSLASMMLRKTIYISRNLL